MALNTKDKRRVVAFIYHDPDGAIDTKAERKAVAFLYNAITEMIHIPKLSFILKTRKSFITKVRESFTTKTRKTFVFE